MTLTKDTLQRSKSVLVPNYDPLSIIPSYGKGSKVFDIENNEYIDFTGGIAVLALGHCHEKILETLQTQSKKLWHVSNYYTNTSVIELAELLCELTFAEKVFFANSGSEVNEAALKLARRFSCEGFSEEKNKIISFHKSFHGRSLFTVTAGGQEKYRQGFGPLPPKILYSKYNDIESFKELIDSNTCAVIMEPVMAEGGVINVDPIFLSQVRQLCNQFETLLIFDEVQTGVGRTGSLFAYQELGVIPDILTSAKALASGFPIGAMLTTTHIANSFQPGTHGSTFGGNPLAASVAKTTLELVSNPELLNGVKEKRVVFEKGLNKINQKFPFMDFMSGLGLLVGCKLKEGFKGKAKEIMDKALEENVMILIAGPDVIRFTPSLIIETSEIHEGLKRFEQTLKKFF